MKWFGLAATFSLAFLLGVVATSFAAKGALPYMMFKETKSDLDHERTLEVIRERVAAQDGWKITTEIDQRAAVLAGGGDDVGPYRILKICHGGYASRMLGADERRFFGVMMPISVAVYEREDGNTYVSLVNGDAISKVFGGEYEDVVGDVRYDMEQIFGFMHLSFSVLE